MQVRVIRAEDLYLWKRETLATSFLCMGMLLAYWGSLNPWFLWPLGPLYVIPSAMLVFTAMLIDQQSSEPFFTRKGVRPAIFAYMALAYYQLLVNGSNTNAYVVQTFSVGISFALFRLSIDKLQALITFLCKAMAVLLAVSIPFYLLYLMGFPMPSRNAVFGTEALYSYSNFYFFMIDDRWLAGLGTMRFHAVFLEPGHLGTATVLLLLTQMGKWGRWYNIVLLVVTLMTLSLAAYVLLVLVVVLAAWVQRKYIVRKLLVVVACVGAIVAGAFLYNDGENMIHDLILLRLVIDDGKMVGDNRVTDKFKLEYESFLQSSDVLIGRGEDDIMTGNSGYRVYLYKNGVIGLLLLTVLYGVMAARAQDKRAWAAFAIMAILCFAVRGYPLWYSNFIPLLGTAYLDFTSKEGGTA